MMSNMYSRPGLAAICALALLFGCSRKDPDRGARWASSGNSSAAGGFFNGPMAQKQTTHAIVNGAVPRGSAGVFANDATGGAAPTADTPKPADSAAQTFAAMADSQPDRYLIKNATISVEADDVRKATTALIQAVQAAKGYVSDMHEQSDGIGGLTATMSVRVPYTVFDRSMQQLSDLGKVLEKQVTAQDVTEEFVDTQAKVRNLKRTELRLLDHLTRTGKLTDTLLVEKELNRVREEVEQLEGRVRFLSHRISFSTISVTLKEKAKVQALVPAESYSPAKEGSDAVRSLVEFGRGILSMLIWVVVWTPVWVPLAVVAFLLIRALVRKYRADQAGRPPRMPYAPFGSSPQPPAGS